MLTSCSVIEVEVFILILRKEEDVRGHGVITSTPLGDATGEFMQPGTDPGHDLIRVVCRLPVSQIHKLQGLRSTSYRLTRELIERCPHAGPIVL